MYGEWRHLFVHSGNSRWTQLSNVDGGALVERLVGAGATHLLSLAGK